jgi:hypothetical protein
MQMEKNERRIERTYEDRAESRSARQLMLGSTAADERKRKKRKVIDGRVREIETHEAERGRDRERA